MTSLEDVERLAGSYVNAFNARDIDGMLACSSSNIVLYPTALSRTRDRYVGHDGVRDFMASVATNPAEYRARMTRVRHIDGERWAAMGQILVGDEPAHPFGLTFTVRDGVFVELWGYLSDEFLLEELGMLD